MPARRQPLTAKTADRFKLYLESVQDPEHEVDVFTRLHRLSGGREKPLLLREDFCGTAAICAAWVRSNKQRQAIGIDLDAKTLAWGEKNNFADLSTTQRERITLLKQDVRSVTSPKADVVAAQNFSHFIFKTRPDLRGYFENVRKSLKPDGIFVLDMVGGPEMMTEEVEERTRKQGFTYVWEHERFDPITHHARYHITFRFRDGTQLRRAFSYDWRLWTLPETKELLLEAGFSQVELYWWDEDKKGNEFYKRLDHAPADPTYLVYVVALP